MRLASADIIVQTSPSTKIEEGDFVEFRQSALGKVLGIFTHELLRVDKRVFLYISAASNEPVEMDPVLNLQQLRLDPHTRLIVGLPSVSDKRNYVVPMWVNSGAGRADNF